MSTTATNSRAIADAINTINAKRTSRAEAAANFIVFFTMALLGAMALVAYITPCAEASLCLAAVVPTHRNWGQRLLDAYQAWRLRWHIRCAQQDMAHMEEMVQMARWECEHIPLQQKVTADHIAQLHHQLQGLGARAGA